jgi:2-polyprenyl-3-methyl-5-hydroxy-6-metoxy-1,4-benzoquinol methylase
VNSHTADLERSWIANAANWTRAVREGLIPSRKAGTDAAIVSAIVERKPKRLLDVGCGEGWLCRRTQAETGCAATGIDASPDLIRDAAQADAQGSYRVATYADLVAGKSGLAAGFDAIVFNYALFEEDLAPVLRAARGLLAPGGAILIQTLHPDAFPQAAEGWRVEDFTAFQNQTPLNSSWTPMPWFYRSVASWHDTISRAGLKLSETRVPRAAPDRSPLSLLLVCGT